MDLTLSLRFCSVPSNYRYSVIWETILYIYNIAFRRTVLLCSDLEALFDVTPSPLGGVRCTNGLFLFICPFSRAYGGCHRAYGVDLVAYLGPCMIAHLLAPYFYWPCRASGQGDHGYRVFV